MKGVALMSVLIITGFLSLLGIGFAFIMVIESKISQAQELATQTHYLAEAGVQYAIWLLNNNWRTDFENGTLLEETKLTNELYSGDEIKIEAKSMAEGEAEITSKAKYQNSQRKIVVNVFKPLGGITEPLEPRALLTETDISMIFSYLKINDGSVQANKNLGLLRGSLLELDVDKSASADTINIDFSSSIIPEEAEQAGAEPLLIPALDFDDYLAKADLVYTKEQFEDLLKQNPVLSGIIYVTGSDSCSIDIKLNQTLTINGFLLSDCSWRLGFQGESFGYTNLIIKSLADKPSGLATKGQLAIKFSTNRFNVEGLVYALKGVQITGARINNYNIKGGLITAGEFYATNLGKLDITYDENIIKQALGQPKDAPMITINHWEEEY